ncbi:O-methyltransferase [Sporolactobacillus spathodeae]|uniref:tRNA 5-hydroxyuridine methyltransferase n=1 Tax=Sporolactobacillus spathodeae TaxID=1465502 RepID=A0ABS2Q6J3_9BACL|nr:O-methyltransferase [Sporolactobacillus spathodeae]MBM7657385.1 putative O-methyltransferase YrrM [Sporolactobacillus spathodeae]
MIDFEKLSAYAAAFSPAENDLLKKMEAKAKAIYIPIMQPSAMAFLQQLIRWIGAKRILELGTAIGYSAIRMRLAAGKAAQITTVERDPQMIAEAKENIEKIGFLSSIQIVEGDATETPAAVQQGAPYDLIVIDAAKAQYEKLFKNYSGLLKPGGIILTDNVFFHGLVYDIDAVKKKQLNRLVHKVDAYNHFLTEQPDFDTVFLTVGDGLAISTKKSVGEENS